MNAFCTAIAIFGLSACGGSIAETESGDAGRPARKPAVLDASYAEDSPAMGVGPIDASSQPTELTLMCDGSTPQLSLKLPCLLGGDFGGGDHVLECQRSTAPSTYSTGNTVFTMTVPLTDLSTELNQAVALPFANAPPSPPGYSEALGPLTGTAVFSQVDLVSDAFVGTLIRASVPWEGSLGDKMTCVVVDGPFWAVAGPFI
jgi:hypothetical protein